MCGVFLEGRRRDRRDHGADQIMTAEKRRSATEETVSDSLASDRRGNELVDGMESTDDDSYHNYSLDSVEGKLMDVNVQSPLGDGALSVGAVHTGEEGGESHVRLRFEGETVSAGTSFNADRARDLADRLRVAADAAEGDLRE